MFHHTMYLTFLKYTYLIYRRKEIGFHNFVFYRAISNYEYTESECAILQSDAILESAQEDDLELNSNLLGKIIHGIWGGKVAHDYRELNPYKT